MELSGNEKRIRALFSELRAGDERIAPEFGVLVNRVKAATIRPRRGFNLSLAWAAVVICAIALAWWATVRFHQATLSPVASTTPANVTTPQNSSAQSVSTTEPEITVRPKSSRANHSQLLARRLVARRHAEILAANKRVLEDASAISKWASPTASLLSSSSDVVLTTLPQLNQNTNQLKSFLPNSSN